MIFKKSDFLKALPKVEKNFTVPFLNYKALRNWAVIKGVSRSFCRYGNLLCHENDNNVFTSNGAAFDTLILASSEKDWW